MVAKRIVFIGLVSIMLNACASSKLHEQDSNKYSVERLQSVNGSSYLSLNFYHFDNKTEPVNAFFHINGIVFKQSNDYQSRVITVIPGSFNIKSGFVGKEWSHAEIEVEKRDSVVVNFFLKDSSEPLYSN